LGKLFFGSEIDKEIFILKEFEKSLKFLLIFARTFNLSGFSEKFYDVEKVVKFVRVFYYR
jgi:hypothetical protein